MENAIYNGKEISASKVSDNYELEKDVRKASARRELRCPDPDCQNSIVKYCHGEIKNAFFSHINNVNCDYAKFDSNDNNMLKSIRYLLFNHFQSKGYNVKIESKVLPHHYTHLLFTFEDNTNVAIEIVNQNISAYRIDFLNNEYKKINLPVKWIVVDDSSKPIDEKQIIFSKRFALNESIHNDLLIIDNNGSDVSQFRLDLNKYKFKGQNISSENYPEIYSEFETLNHLIFEGNELTISGFYQRFNTWLNKKQNAFSKKLKLLQVKEDKKLLLQKQISDYNKMINNQSANHIKSFINENNVTHPVHSQPMTKSHEELKNEILSLIDIPDKPALDSTNQRWIKCKICGTIETSGNFCMYGGSGKDTNLGLCNTCQKSK